MSDITINNINNIINDIQIFKKFISDYSKNQLSKDNFINLEKMNKKNFDIYINELEIKLNKYNISDKFKNKFLDLLKKSYKLIKNDKKKFIKSENYISAKNDIDILINGKTDIKKKYNFYIDQIEKICINYQLNANQIFNLLKYFYEKSEISRREQFILDLKRTTKKLNDITKELKKLKELKELKKIKK